ncbi:hypothetical protein ABZT26_25930 [Streptomyces sp. NPDC005395]|uniref:hypothetical protein n=1 Tax=Streptomyces sp. NPDC005395 TaxID=3157042 RepID=UPI0033A724B8
MTRAAALWAAGVVLLSGSALWASTWPWPATEPGPDDSRVPSVEVLPVHTPAGEPAWTHTCLKGREPSCPQNR